MELAEQQLNDVELIPSRLEYSRKCEARAECSPTKLFDKLNEFEFQD